MLTVGCSRAPLGLGFPGRPARVSIPGLHFTCPRGFARERLGASLYLPLGNPLRPHYTAKATEAQKEDVAVERRRRAFPLARPARRGQRPAASVESSRSQTASLIRAPAESQTVPGAVPLCLLFPLLQLPRQVLFTHILQVRKVGSGRFSAES